MCQAARARDKEAINTLLVQFVSVDVSLGSETPASCLVRSGELEAADFLMEYFGANRDQVGMAAASTGKRDYAFNLFKRGANLRNLLIGFAIADDQDAIIQIYGSLADDIPLNFIEALAIGYGEAGNRWKIETFLAKGLVDAVMLGVIRSGDRQLMDEMIDRYPHSRVSLIQTLAFLGNRELVEHYFNLVEFHNLARGLLDLYKLFAGYLLGGYADYAQEILPNAFPEQLEVYLPMNGNLKLIQDRDARLFGVMGKRQRQGILNHLAENNHTRLYSEFYKSHGLHAKSDVVFRHFFGETKAFYKSELYHDPQSALFNLAFINDEKLCRRLANVANHNLKKFDSRSHDPKTLYQRARRINYLMHRYPIGYHAASYFLQSDVYTWMLMLTKLTLPIDMSVAITTYITCLSDGEVRKLREAIVLETSKEMIQVAIKPHLRSSALHHTQATTFFATVKAATSKEQLDQALTVQTNRETKTGCFAKLFKIKPSRNHQIETFQEKLTRISNRLPSQSAGIN